jgi:hypothetical protein
MTERETAFWVALLLPITWALIQFLLVKPLSKLAHKHLSPNWANALTKKRGE